MVTLRKTLPKQLTAKKLNFNKRAKLHLRATESFQHFRLESSPILFFRKLRRQRFAAGSAKKKPASKMVKKNRHS